MIIITALTDRGAALDPYGRAWGQQRARPATLNPTHRQGGNTGRRKHQLRRLTSMAPPRHRYDQRLRSRTGREETIAHKIAQTHLPRKVTDMSPHDDRRTSQTSALPDWGEPDTIATAFSSGSGLKRISASSHTSAICSSCQYWERRRYGPAQPASRVG